MTSAASRAMLVDIVRRAFPAALSALYFIVIGGCSR